MRIVALALVGALCSTGCSVIAARGPSSTRAPGEVPRCNESKGAVAVDGVMATALGISAIAAGGDSVEAGVAIGVLGAVYLGSALYGNSTANKCRRAISDFELAQEAREMEHVGGLRSAPRAPASPAGPGGAGPGATPPVGPTPPPPPPTTTTTRGPVAVPVRPPVVVRAPVRSDAIADDQLGAAPVDGDDADEPDTDGDAGDGDDDAGDQAGAHPPAGGDAAGAWRNFWVEVEP